MKKILFLIVIAILLLPGTVFAKAPTELEVQETTSAVLATFGIIFLSSMFGEAPEGVDVDMDMTSGKSSMVFNDFDAAAYIRNLGEMTGSDESDADMPEFYFSSMSGTISVDQEGDMTFDVDLKGGNIKKLELKTLGESLEYLKADGKDFSFMDNIFDDE